MCGRTSWRWNWTREQTFVNHLIRVFYWSFISKECSMRAPYRQSFLSEFLIKREEIFKNDSKLTISAKCSKNGRTFISSLSFWSMNQLSIGIPFSSWYLQRKRNALLESKRTRKHTPLTGIEHTQMLAVSCQWWSSWKDLVREYSSLLCSCRSPKHNAHGRDGIYKGEIMVFSSRLEHIQQFDNGHWPYFIHFRSGSNKFNSLSA